jgi:lipopolysaccharide biosynthesis regulator YciM
MKHTRYILLLCLLLEGAGAAAEPMATAGWEAFAAPPAEMALAADGQRHARALALFSRGLRLERTLQKDAALTAYKQAMALDAHNLRLASRMANLMAGMGKFNDALAVLEQTKELNLALPEAWLELSRYCLRNHHGAVEIKTKALQYAKQAVNAFPDCAAAYVQLIRTYFDAQELSGGDPRAKAREVLERAATVPSESSAFWLALVPSAREAYPLDDADTKATNLESILAFVAKAEKFAGNDAVMIERLAHFYNEYATRLKSMSLGKRALPWFEKLTSAAPDNLPAQRAYAALLRQTGQGPKATALFRELVKIDPQDLGSHHALIKVAEEEKDPLALITHRTEILRWAGGTPQEWLDLSAAMIKAQQLESAVSLLKRAQRAHPTEAPLVAQLARVYHLQRQDFDGFVTFQEALALAEKHADAKRFPRNASLLKDSEFHFLGATLAAQQPNQTELAAQWYRKTLEVAPPETPELTARCYHGLASLWLERNEKIEEAGELMRTANSLVPDNAAYMDGLGWYFFKQHDYPAALDQLEKSATLAKGDNPLILSHLSQCLQALNRPEEALKYAEQAAAHPAATPEMKQRATKP